MRYRRATTKGGTYFFTVNLAERKHTLLIDHIDELREAIKQVKRRQGFYLDACVILPDHLHMMWTLPEGDANFAQRWMLIKAGFSRRIEKHERINESRKNKGERGLWQRRYWEHVIKDEADYEHHVNYIHYNPVKHAYVRRASEWPYTSLHRYVASGVISPNWGGTIDQGIYGG